MLFALGGVLLTAAVVFFVFQPILAGRWASLVREDEEPTEAEAQRRVKLLALRDVEYDFVTGKLDTEDYRSLKRELSAEALQALEAARREEAGEPAASDEDLEREIAAVRRGLRSGTTCEGCGHLNPEGSRFCSTCGATLRSVAATNGASRDAGSE